MTIVLREYQNQCVDAIWNAAIMGENKILISLPTASGKTEIFIELLKKANVKSIVAMSSVRLAKQTYERIKNNNLDVGLYCSTLNSKDIDNKIIVGTVQSLTASGIKDVKILTVDEAHCISEEEDSYYGKLISTYSGAKLLGFTATPFRTDGGHIYGAEKIFPRLNFSRSFSYMIENGFLVKPILTQGKDSFDINKLKIVMGDYSKHDIEVLASDSSKANKQVTDALERLGDRKKIIWATSSIKHCNLISDILFKQGEEYARIHSEMEYNQQESNLKFFEDGPARHLVFVSIVKEGYSYSPIDAIVLMRPTRSPVLYVQICGRGLRLSPGKKDCLILDYGRVVESLGPLSDPKIPEDRRYKAAEQSPIKACPKCGTYVPKESSECEFCNYKFSRPVEVRLTAKPATNLIILGEQKNDVFKLSRVEIHDHKSKNGNSCFKVVMYETGILSFRPRHTQWFVKSRPRDFYNLILQLNIDGLAESNYAVDFTHEVEIERKKEGDFYKVIRVTNRASHLRLPKIKL